MSEDGDGFTLHVGVKEILRAVPWIISMLTGLGWEHHAQEQRRTDNDQSYELQIEALETRLEVTEHKLHIHQQDRRETRWRDR